MAIFKAICALIGITGALVVLLECGRWLGKSREHSPGLDTVSGAVFALMGLLIAFTFSGAANRFEERRHLIVEEANAIGTAYLRVDLLPVKDQPVVREDFRKYIDARLAFYRQLADDRPAADRDFGRATALQGKIWRECVAALPPGDTAAKSLLLSALNAMIDITTTRAVALETHPPAPIYFTLVVLVIAATLLAGNEMAGTTTRSWTHKVLYAGILAMAMYLIADLEYPRLGLVRVDAADHVLTDLRRTM